MPASYKFGDRAIANGISLEYKKAIKKESILLKGHFLII
ncbi:MAG: hypothetical protein ACI9N1_000657 [Flavobacteriales bacterium]|jgi:hypothetical protein